MHRPVSRGVTLRRALLALALLVLGGYLSVVVYLVSQETAIVFRNDAPMGALRPAAPFEAVELRRPDGTHQPLWIMRTASASETRPWVVFLHGNGSPIS